MLPDLSQLSRETESPPFFVVGSGRSGSTLLRMMLASHSRIAIPPETWFLLPLVEQFPIDKALNGEELSQVIAVMTTHYRWPDMMITAEDLQERAAGLATARIRDVVRIVYDIHLQRSGKLRWGDKTPPYVRIIPQLATIFPGARFICLIRDGRDVAKSFQSLRVYGKSVRQNTIEWLEANRWERKWLASEHASSMLRVRYENLVVDPEATLRRICEFIGVPFEPQMLAWQDSVKRLVPKRELHVHEKLARTTSHDDVARWKREMSDREVFMAEAFMGRDLRRLGYECQFSSSVWHPVFWLIRAYYDFLLPLNPIRVVQSLARRLGRETVNGAFAASSAAADELDTAVRPRGPAPRAVDPSKIGLRRHLR